MAMTSITKVGMPKTEIRSWRTTKSTFEQHLLRTMGWTAPTSIAYQLFRRKFDLFSALSNSSKVHRLTPEALIVVQFAKSFIHKEIVIHSIRDGDIGRSQL